MAKLEFVPLLNDIVPIAGFDYGLGLVVLVFEGPCHEAYGRVIRRCFLAEL